MFWNVFRNSVVPFLGSTLGWGFCTNEFAQECLPEQFHCARTSQVIIRNRGLSMTLPWSVPPRPRHTEGTQFFVVVNILYEYAVSFWRSLQAHLESVWGLCSNKSVYIFCGVRGEEGGSRKIKTLIVYKKRGRNNRYDIKSSVWDLKFNDNGSASCSL